MDRSTSKSHSKKVVPIDLIRIRTKINKLVSIKHTLPPAVRYDVEDLKYRLDIGSPIGSVSYIEALYREYFTKG